MKEATKFTATTPFGTFKRSSQNHTYAFVVVRCGRRESSIIDGFKQNAERAQVRADIYGKVVDLESFKAYCLDQDKGRHGSAYAQEHGNFAATTKLYDTPAKLAAHIADFAKWAAADRAIVKTNEDDKKKALKENADTIASRKGEAVGWRRDRKLAEQLVKQEQAWGAIAYVFPVDQKGA